nr:hypothetical protein [Ancylomarina sp. DW003]
MEIMVAVTVGIIVIILLAFKTGKSRGKTIKKNELKEKMNL